MCRNADWLPRVRCSKSEGRRVGEPGDPLQGRLQGYVSAGKTLSDSDIRRLFFFNQPNAFNRLSRSVNGPTNLPASPHVLGSGARQTWRGKHETSELYVF
jgi:hypothetical protein